MEDQHRIANSLDCQQSSRKSCLLEEAKVVCSRMSTTIGEMSVILERVRGVVD
jgi:hypothetical protein